jgi:DNA-binding MarR family transcriptional regulator
MTVEYCQAMARTGKPLVDPREDIGLLCQVIASATSERVLERLTAAGFDDVRVSHGFVIQGLLAGDATVTDLAQRLGVSSQAVSKSVIELEQRGYVVRRRDAGDGRARTIELTDRATAMLAVSRQARLDLQHEITAHMGPGNARSLARLLRTLSERVGGEDAISGRRVRPVGGLA